jgi:hypothetical protein
MHSSSGMRPSSRAIPLTNIPTVYLSALDRPLPPSRQALGHPGAAGQLLPRLPTPVATVAGGGRSSVITRAVATPGPSMAPISETDIGLSRLLLMQAAQQQPQAHQLSPPPHAAGGGSGYRLQTPADHVAARPRTVADGYGSSRPSSGRGGGSMLRPPALDAGPFLGGRGVGGGGGRPATSATILTRPSSGRPVTSDGRRVGVPAGGGASRAGTAHVASGRAATWSAGVCSR